MAPPTTLIVNCYYCRGTGGRRDAPCETCEGEGRLRLSEWGLVEGPQRMSEEERGYDSFRMSQVKRYRSRAAPPPALEAPDETGS